MTMFRSGLIKTGSYGENYDALYLGSVVLALELRRWSGKAVYAAYAFSNEPISPEKMLEIAITQADGNVSAEYEDRYSEITGYLWTDEKGKIGGHDLLRVFRSNIGKYGALVISQLPIELDDIGSVKEVVEYVYNGYDPYEHDL